MSDELPTQPTLNRMARFGVRPKRDLGQNFLVDSNILGVIERAAELAPDDVVLEIGGGVGVLSEFLAARAAHVHVSELDASLEPALRDALDPYGDRVTLHLGDALKLDLPGLDPLPTKVVANLPYGIAATAILDTVAELPSVTRWVAMVQREVGERLAAAPGSDAYGVPSAIAQAACRVRVHRGVARTVFHPVPHVDSVLVVLERTGPPPTREYRRLVQAAFAHRRKALARSLQLAWGRGDVREAVRAALVDLGLPPDVPAQVAPGRWLATGAGERVAPLPDPAPYGVLVLPGDGPLSTPEVYREADRLGLPRDAEGLARGAAEVAASAAELPDALCVNELAPAALSLRPSIEVALAQAREAGADLALVSGSGPTVLGLFREPAEAMRAAAELGRHRPALASAPLVRHHGGAPA